MYSYDSLKVMLELRRPWRKIRYVDAHQSQPMIRSQLEGATRDYPRAHAQTSASRFRNPHDISFISIARYRALANGSATQGNLSSTFFPHESDLAGYTRESLPALFCINAGLGDEALRSDRILRRLFPTPSAFELADPVVSA